MSQSTSRPFVAIQIGAVSFVDEGVGPVLDLLQERAGVNALLLANPTWTRGLAGALVRGRIPYAMLNADDLGGVDPARYRALLLPNVGALADEHVAAGEQRVDLRLPAGRRATGARLLVAGADARLEADAAAGSATAVVPGLLDHEVVVVELD